jgi:hypothetical protein
MSEQETIERAHHDKEQGKSPATQAGEFVREEIHHVRAGKHGARSAQQAIAIGLSKARRAGVKLKAPKKGRASRRVRTQAKRDLAKGRARHQETSRTRSRGVMRALRRESHKSASKSALSRQARRAARLRGHTPLHRAAIKAVHTKGKKGLRHASDTATNALASSREFIKTDARRIRASGASSTASRGRP